MAGLRFNSLHVKPIQNSKPQCEINGNYLIYGFFKIKLVCSSERLRNLKQKLALHANAMHYSAYSYVQRFRLQCERIELHSAHAQQAKPKFKAKISRPTCTHKIQVENNGIGEQHALFAMIKATRRQCQLFHAEAVMIMMRIVIVKEMERN